MRNLKLFLFVAIFIAATSASNNPGVFKIEAFVARYRAWALFRKSSASQKFFNLVNRILTQLKNHPKISLIQQLSDDTNLKTNITTITESLNRAVMNLGQMIRNCEEKANKFIESMIEPYSDINKAKSSYSAWFGINVTECYESPEKILEDAFHGVVNFTDCMDDNTKEDALNVIRIVEARWGLKLKSIEIAQKGQQCADVLDSEAAIACTTDATNDIAGIYIETMSTIKQECESVVALFESSLLHCKHQEDKFRTLEEEIKKIRSKGHKCAEKKI